MGDGRGGIIQPTPRVTTVPLPVDKVVERIHGLRDEPVLMVWADEKQFTVRRAVPQDDLIWAMWRARAQIRGVISPGPVGGTELRFRVQGSTPAWTKRAWRVLRYGLVAFLLLNWWFRPLMLVVLCLSALPMLAAFVWMWGEAWLLWHDWKRALRVA